MFILDQGESSEISEKEDSGNERDSELVVNTKISLEPGNQNENITTDKKCLEVEDFGDARPDRYQLGKDYLKMKIFSRNDSCIERINMQ